MESLDQQVAWQIWFDGLCEPKNPGGTIAWGTIITSPDGDSVPLSGVMPAAGTNTNNLAEYLALGKGLARVLELLESRTAAPRHVQVFGDSKLVICQITGAWACNAPHLQKLRDRCRELAKQITGDAGTFAAQWIPREKNEAADALGRQAFFKATGKQPPERAKQKASSGK